MRSTLVAFALTFAVVNSSGSQAFAQAAKARTARGTVTAMAGDSVTVKVGTTDMTFAVDAKTQVTAVGGGTKQKAAQQAGAPGAKLVDVIKVGQPVTVRYHDMAGKLHAASITAVSTAGANPAAAKESNGTVQSVSATSMTISGSSGAGAKFTQTFVIDNNTKVVGKGASTATKGAKVAITDLVGSGDQVAVSYHATGTELHASNVRVMNKATK
jgi:uncharacterized protein DUF5666